MSTSNGSRKELNLGGQNFLDIVCAIGFFIGLPAIRMLQKGRRLRPRKWFWIILGVVGILLTFLGIAAMAPIHILLTIPMAIYSIHVNREYVIKYNVMVRSGYFENKERMRQANIKRIDQTYERQAQASMDKALKIDTRVNKSKEIKKPVKPVTPTPAIEAKKPAQDYVQTVADNKRKLDL